MGPDLKSKGWIVAKGALFAFLALASATLQVIEDYPVWIEIGLLAICIWASCRFYYFLFYVLHSYVDPDLKSAGLLDLSGKLLMRLIPRIRARLPDPEKVTLRRLQTGLAAVCMAFAVAGMVLPLLGIRGVMDSYRSMGLVISLNETLKWIGPALVGPFMLLLCGGTVIYCVLCRKRLPWLIPLFSFPAVYGVKWGGGPVSHDLGHALFDSCTGYSEFIVWVSLVGAVSIPTCYFLNLREHESRIHMPGWFLGFSRKFKVLIVVVASILVVLLAVIWLMDLI